MLICLSPSGLFGQAAITWGPATYIAGDSDVATNGAVLRAYNFTSDSTNVILAGITFTGTSGSTADLNFTTRTGTNFFANSGAFGGYQTSTLSAGYQSLLQSAVYWDVTGAYSNDAPSSLTLNNLQPGQQYQVQLWVHDARDYGNDRADRLSDGFGNKVTISFNHGATGTLGAFATGSFTAIEASQTIYFELPSGNSMQLNAMSVSAIPEPSTYAALAGGGALAAAFWRKRRRAD